MEDLIATFTLLVVVALALIFYFGPIAAVRDWRRRRGKTWH